jgi:uncharacterized protein
MRDDLKAALKARDRVAISAIRSALAAIDNAEAVATDHRPFGGAIESSPIGVGATEAQRRDLTDADLRSVINNEVRERSTAADEYEQLGRTDHANQLRAEAEILRRYLQ